MSNLRNSFLIFSALLLYLHSLSGQTLRSITINQCYTWAEENYPLIQQLDLIEKSTAYNLNNAAKGYLPQININGQASYQSEVTQVPIDAPNLDIPVLDKDQYKLYADIYLPLTNRAQIKTSQAQIEASAAVDKQKVRADLYQLKDRVNQLYFGVLLLDEQMVQLQLLLEDLNAGLDQIKAGIANGTATESNQFLLAAEVVQVEQRIQEQTANRSAFILMLAKLTGKGIAETTDLQKPTQVTPNAEINRPELQLFSLQENAVSLQAKQIDQRIIPGVGLFFQGGIGRPALNFLSNELSPYYIGGLRLNWNLSNLYRSKNDHQLLNLNRQKIQTQRESFLLNTDLTLTQQSAEIEKYKQLISSDQRVINLRKSVKETAQVQLSNGLISALDFVQYANAENKARQSLVLHSTQLLLAQYNLKTTSGN